MQSMCAFTIMFVFVSFCVSHCECLCVFIASESVILSLCVFLSNFHLVYLQLFHSTHFSKPFHHLSIISSRNQCPSPLFQLVFPDNAYFIAFTPYSQHTIEVNNLALNYNLHLKYRQLIIKAAEKHKLT